MIDVETARRLALSFPEVVEQDHWGKPSFRVKKKIFATLHVETKRAVLKLSPVDQSVFSAFDKSIIYPVEDGWGKQGWTFVELAKVRKAIFKDALATAYRTVAPKEPSDKLQKKSR